MSYQGKLCEGGELALSKEVMMIKTGLKVQEEYPTKFLPEKCMGRNEWIVIILIIKLNL